MSNVDPELEETTPDDLKQLREAAARGKEAKAAAEANELRAVFAEAGVPKDTAIAKLFRESYKGERTEDAVKAAWAELAGEMTAKAPEPDPDPTDDLEGLAAARGQATGVPVDPGLEPPEDPRKAGRKAFQETLAQGKPNAVASAQILDRLIDAAAKGNESVIVKPWTRDEITQAHREIGR